jgi:hypothetical protein
VDTLVSRSAQPASDSAPKTHDTSGRLSQPELLQCDQVPAFLKTSTDISRWGFPTFCKTWQDWVTERRGAWRQRVNAVRLTRGSGSSSWPTISVNESKNSVGKSQLDRNSIPLGTSVLDGGACLLRQNATAGTTMNPEMSARSADSTIATIANAPDQLKTATNTPNLMEFYTQGQSILGQAAPASSNTLGSRQGLWLTPRANEPDSDPNFAARNADRGAHCHGTLSSQTKQWATPTNCDHKGATTPEACKQWESRGQNLPEQTASITAGRLNPRWVETLQGLPIGWAMPSCTRPVTIAPTSCDSSETALCRPAQSERSDFLLASWPSPRAGESQQTDELSRLWVECGYKQPKTRRGKPRANNSTYDVTLETAVRGVAKAETNP